MKVVFDTVIFVRSLLNPYSRYGQLVFSFSDEYTLVVSEPIAREVLEVLSRPQITRKFRFVEGMDMTRILDLLSQAELVEVTDIPPVSRDPKDDKFLATASVAGVEYVISEDRDLLDLIEYEGIKIVDATTLLRALGHDEQHRGEKASVPQ